MEIRCVDCKDYVKADSKLKRRCFYCRREMKRRATRDYKKRKYGK